MNISMDDLSSLIYSQDTRSDLLRLGLNEDNVQFIEKARKDQSTLYLWKNLPKELYEKELGIREITPGDPRYGNTKETEKFERGMSSLADETTKNLSHLLPENIFFVPSQCGSNYCFVDPEKSTQKRPSVLELGFYTSGILELNQFLTAELIPQTGDGASKVTKVYFKINGDIRNYKESEIMPQARYFAQLIREKISLGLE